MASDVLDRSTIILTTQCYGVPTVRAHIELELGWGLSRLGLMRVYRWVANIIIDTSAHASQQ